jgi:hypothetical protein
MSRECVSCTRPATCVVHVQWSLFDFDQVEACDEHMGGVISVFSRTKVDGQLPADLWTSQIRLGKSDDQEYPF